MKSWDISFIRDEIEFKFPGLTDASIIHETHWPDEFMARQHNKIPEYTCMPDGIRSRSFSASLWPVDT
jgi:hypothetical protein